MDKVDKYMTALDILPKDNGKDLSWHYCLTYMNGIESIRIIMQNPCTKLPVTQRFIPIDNIYAMDDPESAAAKVIENMYEEAEEHNNAKRRLMSPEEAAGILREYAKNFEECGAWDPLDINDEDLIAALNVAIKCLEVKI